MRARRKLLAPALAAALVLGVPACADDGAEVRDLGDDEPAGGGTGTGTGTGTGAHDGGGTGTGAHGESGTGTGTESESGTGAEATPGS